MSDTVERHGFGADVGRVLDLVVHSLYSEREIFLRELVANAADATDRRRFAALSEPALALAADAKVRITPDRAARLLTVADDGIGMDKAELAENLGTIARSGTRAFGETAAAKPDERPALIGQFGVGFYAAFMVAERVDVVSRKAGAEEAWRWSCSAESAGEYTLSPALRERVGTDVVLHLKADATEFLEPARLETIIRKWADHITVPISITRDGKDVAANEGTALWRKPKADVSEADATAFYRHLGNFFGAPWATIQWRAEGTIEFYAMLFIPDGKPFEPLERERRARVRLHVRRMFITDEADLLPSWLRFTQGVVDTEDLPLNVSREMLQATPVLARLRKAATGRVLGELKARAAKPDDYALFWNNFGAILKEGVWEDHDHRDEIAPLLRFRSSALAADAWTSLPDYISRMKEDQDAIWYLVGEDAAALARSPQIEGLRAAGTEVLLLTDAIDGFWPARLGAFDGKLLRSVTQADATTPAVSEDIGVLLATMKATLGEQVAAVRATSRLTDSAAVLAAGTADHDLATRRLLHRAGQGKPAVPVLEVNPDHALVRALLKRDRAVIAEAAAVLLDIAFVQDGEPPADAAGFARRMTDLLAKSLN